MNNLKTLLATTILATSFSTAAFSQISVGISAAYGNFDGEARETNVTAKAAKSGDADFPFASIFAEYSTTLDKSWKLAIGLDYIPLETEVEAMTRSSTSQNAGAGQNGTGNTTAKMELKNHATLYIQPSYMIDQTLSVFGKVGYSQADLNITSSNAATGSSLNKKDTLEGYLVGIGIQKDISKTTFVRLEGNYTDYDTVNYTNSTGTKFTGDGKLMAAKVSIGTSF
jgi:opacity protein-like surface antigen